MSTTTTSYGVPVDVLALVRPGMSAWEVLLLEYEMYGEYEDPEIEEEDISKDIEDKWLK